MFQPIRASLLLALLLVSLCMAGCAPGAEPTVEKTIFVASHMVDCVGEAQQVCYLVKENPDDEYTFFYDQIVGFDYELGYAYELRINEETIKDPPADASSIKWTLIEVVSKVEVPGIPAELLDVEWVLGTFGAVGAEDVVGGNKPITLQFTREYQIGGSSGCNQYFGSFEVGPGDALSFGVIGATEMACLEDGVMDQEQRYFAALAGVSGFALAQDRLQLLSDDGQSVLTYVIPEAGIANPASVYCEEQGGRLEIRTDADGGQVGICVFDDGSECEEWAFFRGECAPGAGDADESLISLEGSLWTLDSYLDSQGDLADVLLDTEVTLEFEAGQIAGSSGCNSYFAPYEVEGSNLTIGQIGSTLMACEPAVMEQEAQVLAALQSAATYQIADGSLQIVDADGKTVLTFSVLEPAPLTGTTWRLTRYNNGTGGFVSVLDGVEITAVFGDDGSLTGSAGCNTYGTSYEITGEAVQVGPVAATRMMCAEPAGVMEQESAYLEALRAVATWRIRGNALELFGAGGERLAAYAGE